MAVKFNLRMCLQLMNQGISLNTISKQYHISKHTSSKVKRRKEELEFDTAKLKCYSDTELGKLFFPNLYESEDIYAPIDYEYIHNELSKPGVTLKLLWNEDEWLMYEMSDQDKQFISELMEVRHDTCSTIFCSQYPTEDWYDKLHKSTLTEALLDRIVHNRIDIDMGTENFRIK